MYIKELQMNGIGVISGIEISLNRGLNLICGPNGVGKTTILECIAHSFSNYGSNILKKNVNADVGKWKINFANNNQEEIYKEFEIKNYHPEEKSYNSGLQDYSRYLIVFKTHRSIDYLKVDAIARDQSKNLHNIMQEITIGSGSNNIKSWFLNRFLWSAQEGALSEEQLKNLELAKKCFGMLDGKVSFSKVIASTHDIIVKTSEGEVYFEYLSSGYKSSLFILLGLIKIIEERYVESPILIEDFDGIILIDEIDLHLHPQWQASLLKLVKSLVPNAQIIATTHSPHMIQVAESNEIIALNFDDVDGVVNRGVNQSEYGFQGWTVEEILEDVMGLRETRSEGYLAAISDFNDAISSENIGEAYSNYEVLDSMLHPNNHLRKLLKFQLASLGAED